MLRYAELAERASRILREHGGFLAEDVVLVAAPDDAALRRALIEVNARIRAAGSPALLFVYCSGHSDAEALHLGRTRFPIDDLRKLVTGSAVDARILVLGACRSGALTRE